MAFYNGCAMIICCIIDGNSVFLRMISLLKHMHNTHTDLC